VAPASKQNPELPPGHPVIGEAKSDPHAGMQAAGMPAIDPHAATGGVKAASVPRVEKTDFEGITLQVPEGWLAEVPDVNQQMPQLSAKAVFRLPPPEGEVDPAFLRVTHFPEMKGMDQMNLERWYTQFTQPDGRATKEVARIENFDLGEIKVLFADISGTTKAGMVEQPNQRMLSAIINHPRGPHFVKVLGPDKTVAHWRESVVAYLRSTVITGEPAAEGQPKGE
jgi:hypothetical protein